MSLMAFRRSLPDINAAVRRGNHHLPEVNTWYRTHRSRPTLRFARVGAYAAGGSIAAGLSWVLVDGTFGSAKSDRDNALSGMTLSQLLRGHLVFTCCSIPGLIELSPAIIDTFQKIPLLGPVVNSIIRATFFPQFCGGESTQDAIPVMQALRRSSIGALFCCNIEANHHDGAIDVEERVGRMIRSIHTARQVENEFTGSSDAAAAGNNRTWISIKLTGLVKDPKVLQTRTAVIQKSRARDGAAQGYFPYVVGDGDWDRLWVADPSISKEDHEQLAQLYRDLQRVMSVAKEQNIAVFVDAEQTWYQPVIDILTEGLMREFNGNTEVPIVCGTFQAYLRRNPELIASQVERARAGGYSLGYKIVRGAYMDAERQAWREAGNTTSSPVWDTKSDTDKSYNSGMLSTITRIKENIQDGSTPRVLALFGSHNVETVKQGLQQLVNLGLATRAEGGKLSVDSALARHMSFGQLLGMKDGLTGMIVGQTENPQGIPMVVKVVPWGTVEESMPYLARRAVENKAIMSGPDGAKAERKRLAVEVVRRVMSFQS